MADSLPTNNACGETLDTSTTCHITASNMPIYDKPTHERQETITEETSSQKAGSDTSHDELFLEFEMCPFKTKFARELKEHHENNHRTRNLVRNFLLISTCKMIISPIVWKSKKHFLVTNILNSLAQCVEQFLMK